MLNTYPSNRVERSGGAELNVNGVPAIRPVYPFREARYGSTPLPAQQASAFPIPSETAIPNTVIIDNGGTGLVFFYWNGVTVVQNVLLFSSLNINRVVGVTMTPDGTVYVYGYWQGGQVYVCHRITLDINGPSSTLVFSSGFGEANAQFLNTAYATNNSSIMEIYEGYQYVLHSINPTTLQVTRRLLAVATGTYESKQVTIPNQLAFPYILTKRGGEFHLGAMFKDQGSSNGLGFVITLNSALDYVKQQSVTIPTEGGYPQIGAIEGKLIPWGDLVGWYSSRPQGQDPNRYGPVFYLRSDFDRWIERVFEEA